MEDEFSLTHFLLGMDFFDDDLIDIKSLAKLVIGMVEYREEEQKYLLSKMESIAPNLLAVERITPEVGARLISRAGSLQNLAKYPASKVQLLGAEKKMLRYILLACLP